MNALHGLIALVLLYVVMKWYSSAQMCYWSSCDEMDCEPDWSTQVQEPELATGERNHLRSS